GGELGSVTARRIVLPVFVGSAAALDPLDTYVGVRRASPGKSEFPPDAVPSTVPAGGVPCAPGFGLLGTWSDGLRRKGVTDVPSYLHGCDDLVERPQSARRGGEGRDRS